ncbi:unnamed protein product [Arabidopsis lyrata]|uniref:Predicted protein n=1 Tax=Arabidopsis lyrata subsp. lyrata TaxID=81972 RepID=D7LM32_ARALL|nr:predicted protein [Arabidopsis lyrata subsp. lyrata]CAH8267082.1 unnamed protein product [Arabidopsis lyrata]
MTCKVRKLCCDWKLLRDLQQTLIKAKDWSLILSIPVGEEHDNSSLNCYATASKQSCGSTVFRAGFIAGPSGTQTKNSKSRRRPSQWKRKTQALAKAKEKTNKQDLEKNKAVMVYKRKATDEALTSSKLAKRDEEKVVPHEEPPKQI